MTASFWHHQLLILHHLKNGTRRPVRKFIQPKLFSQLQTNTERTVTMTQFITSEHNKRKVFMAFTPPAPEKRTIKPGDRIFARLTMNTGETVEFYTTMADGLSEVIGEVRQRARHLRGLGKVWIRNTSCGWATERPLRLYGSSWTPTPSSASATYRLTSDTNVRRQRNLGPWDTH